MIAAPANDDGTADTFQRIWTRSWHYRDVASGRFVSHPTHNHIHFDAFERYRLLNDAGDVVAESAKVSFCLRNSVRILDDARQPTIGPMLSDQEDCGAQQQIIDAGFGDHYHALLDDQWIDITGVPAGPYVLEIAVDPLDLIIESDETNNVGRVDIVID